MSKIPKNMWDRLITSNDWYIYISCIGCSSGFPIYGESLLCPDCALKHKRNPIIEKLNLIRS